MKSDTRALLRRQRPLLYFSVRVSDVLAILTCGLLAYGLRFDNAELLPKYLAVTVVGAVLALFVFPRAGVYRHWRGDHIFVNFRRLLIAWMVVAVILLIFAFLTKTTTLISRQWFTVWVLSSIAGFICYRFILNMILRRFVKTAWQKTRVVIVGSGDLARDVSRRIRAAHWSGFWIVGHFDDLSDDSAKTGLLGPISDLVGYLQTQISENLVDEVWIALPLDAYHDVKRVVHDLRHIPVAIRYIPDIFEFRLINHGIAQIEGIPVIDLNVTPMFGANRLLKATEDMVLGLLIFLLISPVFLVIALGVKLSSPGSVFYRQERVSWNGKSFEMLKFRSMLDSAEAESGPVWAKEGEQRATRFGRFLRRTSLDELPQFINVIKGDMSIVGPRPERPVFVEKFKGEIPDYMQKHLVKGGITGWAQINGWRGNTDLEKRIEYDLFYIENWSLFFDLKIIFLTVFRAFLDKNAY